MTTAPCFGKRLGHQFVGGVCLNMCGTRQEDLTKKEEKPKVDFFDGYLKRLLDRPVKEGRDYREQLTLPYLKNFIWESLDGEKFLRQTRRFWASTHVGWKQYTPFEYENILKWASGRDGMTVESVCRALTKPKTKPKWSK